MRVTAARGVPAEATGRGSVAGDSIPFLFRYSPTARHALLPLAAALLAGLMACDLVTAPGLPSGAQRISPPAVYAKWWGITEGCSGRLGDMSDIRWYVVPGVTTIPSSEGPAVGIWYSRGNAIVLTSEAMNQGDVVRHEMLHALLAVPGHPRDAFLERCRGVVDCADGCIRDGGKPPAGDPNALIVPPESLEVDVEVSPSSPGAAVDDGNFMMIIRVRNPLRVPVSVQLPPSDDAGPPVTFEYDAVNHGRVGTSGGLMEVWFADRADVAEDTRFQPGEVKRRIFDFSTHFVPKDWRYALPPSTWEFKGSYGGVWAGRPPTVTVSP